MALRSALYYPHTELRGERAEELWKQALLLWDELHFIVPWSAYQPYYEDGDHRDAWQVIGRGHVPSESEMAATHEEIEELVTRPNLPEVFTYNSWQHDYEMYPQKLLPKTWQMLQEMGWRGQLLSDGDYPVSEATGQSLMALLADNCAGVSKARITNRGDAYVAISKLLEESDPDPTQAGTVREELVNTTLEVLDLQDVPIQRLVDYRKKEDGKNGHVLRDLRHRYLDKIEEHVGLITDPTKTEGDRTEHARLFKVEMKDDVEQLRSELGLDTRQVFFSKEFLGAVVLGVGAALNFAGILPVNVSEIASFTTAGGAPVALGGILGVKTKFAAARAQTLAKHPMAYLYHSQKGLLV